VLFSKSTLIILTRNEVEGISSLFNMLPLGMFDEVLVINGKSRDGTVEFCRSKGLKVISQRQLGRGAAFLEATERATGEILVFFSPDGNEDPSVIPELVRLLEGGYDLAIASRFAKNARSDDSDDPWHIRRIGNRLFTYIVNALWDAKVTDSINGFRAIKKSKLLELRQDALGYDVELQMTIRAAKSGYRIAEVPTIEMRRIGGSRKSETWWMGVKFLKVILKELFHHRVWRRRVHSKSVRQEPHCICLV